ncbi:MAG: TerB family tellurite resistance protein [Salinisphaera sp.]|nr:TerB family tellurite resistance protein [Salinisphaera sp.]
MKLLDRIKASLAADSAGSVDPEHSLQLAAAVLLLEMRHADYEHSASEREEVCAQLGQHFDLDSAEVDALLEAAEPEQRQAISLHSYLQVINEHMDVAAKRRVLEMLWRVAYADSKLDANEENLLRHVADLLYLPHREFIRTKLAVGKEREA